jgi:hypothetical protein
MCYFTLVEGSIQETGHQLRFCGILVELTFGLQGFLFLMQVIVRCLHETENHVWDVIPGDGSQPEAKKNGSEKSSQIQRYPNVK